MERLRAHLAEQGRAFWSGVGEHPSNDWPGEPSFLVWSSVSLAPRAWPWQRVSSRTRPSGLEPMRCLSCCCCDDPGGLAQPSLASEG